MELTQENAETSAGAVGDTDKFTVRFSAGECDVDGCVGKARSSGGAVYAFAWDGAALVLSRKDDRIETSCGNQGTVQTLHEFSFEPVQVTGTPTSRPDEMRVRMIDDARIVPDTATDDCDLSLAGDVSYTFELVLSAT